MRQIGWVFGYIKLSFGKNAVQPVGRIQESKANLTPLCVARYLYNCQYSPPAGLRV